jgi:hypothetical protein
MRNRSWNKAALGAALYAVAATVLAQTPAPPLPAAANAARGSQGDALADALTCRIGYERYPRLMELLRRERPDDFRQTYRQYSAPAMDLYQLESPVRAWGQDSDTVLIASSRVMMAVEGSLEEVTARVDQALEQSRETPLSGALNDLHALVIFDAAQPGLEGMVLLGCEYRIPDVSLLDEPEDAWRRKLRAAPTVPVPGNP